MAILKDLIVSGSSRLLGKLYANDIEIGNDIDVAGKTTTKQIHITSVSDIEGSGNTTGQAPLLIGNPTGGHLEFDTEEIIAKSNASTPATLYLNYNGGTVALSNGTAITASNGTMHATNFTGSNVGTSSSYITNAYVTAAAITTANTSTINNSGNIYNKNGTIETDTIKSNKWEIVSTQNLGGDFFVAPTIMVTNGSTFTISSVSGKTITGTLKDTTNITSANFGGHTWSANSLIKITGKLTSGSTHYVLGVCDGKLTSQMGTTQNTINFQITCNASTVPPAGTYTITDGTVMMYNIGGSNKVGIYMTCYGTDKYTYIDIYNGSNGNTPVARLGKLDNLKDGSGNRIKVGDALTTDYGIYTKNGFFEGKVVANGGTIAGWTIGDGYITTNSNRKTYDNTSYTGMTMTASGIGARGSADSYFNLSINGGLTAKGANITGTITASAGSIGGFHITSSGNSDATSANGGHIYTSSLYRHSGDGTTYEYEVGIKGDATENPSSTNTQSGNLAFYARRIAKGAKWNTSETMFSVTHDGRLYAKSADITGKITAQTGSIAGFTLKDGVLSTNDHTAWNTDRDGIYLSSSGIAGGKKGIWYLWKDGSAKIGDLFLSKDGVLNVPAANVSGKLTAATIDGDKITANTITGDKIKAQTISTDKLIIGDTSNYSQLNDSTASYWGFTADTTADGHWYTMNTLARDKFISDYFECQGGETFQVSFEISTSVKGNSSSGGTDSAYKGTAIGIYCYNDANSSVGILYSNRVTATSSATATKVNSTVGPISTNARKFRIFVQTDSYGNFSGTMKLRNIRVYKASGPFITYVSASDGIKIHNANDTTDYLQLNSTAIKMYRNNVQKMYLDDSNLQFTNGSTVLAQFGTGGATIGQTTGTYGNVIIEGGATNASIKIRQGDTVLSSFTSSGATIGANSSGTTRTVITSTGIDFIRKDGSTDVNLAHIGYDIGNAGSGTSTKPFYTFGLRRSGYSVGNYSIAEGNEIVASGYCSHAEGYLNVASGVYAHAEGHVCHATAVGTHAEGGFTHATGMYSHSQGYGTKALSDYQTVIGRLNVEDDEDKYAFIIGNGFEDAEDASWTYSNALTVDWNGGLQCGNIKCGIIEGESVANNSYKAYTINFSPPFPDSGPLPIVTATMSINSTGYTYANLGVYVATRTRSSCTIHVFNASGGAKSPWIMWMATTSGLQ